MIRNKSEFQKAREIIINAFENHSPGGIRFVYLSNIAMLLHDRYGVPVDVANDQANAILDLCFSKIEKEEE